MDGQAVFKLAVGVLEEVAARGARARPARSEADIDWLIPHQANIRIMQSTAKKLKLPLEKLIVTVDQHGNTSAASIPLALDERCAAEDQARRHRDARRRRRRLHLGRGAARFRVSDDEVRDSSFPARARSPSACSTASGQPRSGADAAPRLDALGVDIARLIREGPKESAGPDHQHPAGDAGGRRRCYRAWLAEGGARARAGRRPLPGRVHGAGRRRRARASRTRCRWCAFARRRCRRRCRSGRARWRRSSACDADGREGLRRGRAAGRSGRGRQLQRPGADRDRRATKAASRRACEACKAKGAKRALLLPVSAPFHSSLMKPAAETAEGQARDVAFRSPQIPVDQQHRRRDRERAGGDPRRAGTAGGFGRCAGSRAIQAMRAQGVTHVVECGPGKVLAGMVKRIGPRVAAVALADRASLRAGAEALRRCIRWRGWRCVTGASRGIGGAIAARSPRRGQGHRHATAAEGAKQGARAWARCST